MRRIDKTFERLNRINLNVTTQIRKKRKKNKNKLSYDGIYANVYYQMRIYGFYWDNVGERDSLCIGQKRAKELETKRICVWHNNIGNQKRLWNNVGGCFFFLFFLFFALISIM